MSSVPVSLGDLEPELRQVCEDVYAYLEPDGSWWLNNHIRAARERSRPDHR